ncbi:MAG: cytochrome c oxidase accessory protein CcoG, partial [Bacteroidia bacterium]|nr:cytochrome c oxidase accessory protein CcoG [Bacteroidia bacterium]
GKRAWIYPQMPKGFLYELRKKFTLIYLIVFFALPFIKINGHPLFMLNVIERKFILFGYIFWPQDFVIFGLAMVTGIIFIALFTVAFGRVFCGWACPQTIFMETVFRRIEYWIEGNATQQKRLNNSPWNKNKIIKKGSKYILFYLISFAISITFLAYILGVDEMATLITKPLDENIGLLTGLIIFASIFYFVFAWFREQACLVVCPYGRLQGVLLDKNSIVVAYDYVRGEPRGKLKKSAEPIDKGDCVDCFQCVKVCPTGIDIRNGTQLECVNCTACIDACDHMMESVNKPKGLIRYDSEAGIKEGKKLTFTPRLKFYTTVLILLLGILTTLIVTRPDVDAVVMRTPGMLFQEQPNNQLSNLYNIKIVNKTFKDILVTVQLQDIDGAIKMVGKNELIVNKESIVSGTFFVMIDKNKLKQRKTNFTVLLIKDGKIIETAKTNFMAPIY